MNTPEKPTVKTSMLRKVFLPLLLIVTVLSTVLAGFFFLQYRSIRAKDPANNVNEVVTKVGKLAALPEGETPTLATVSDRDKLTDQDFFSKAENGDKVLVYLKAGKAYLYRPSLNRIIDIAPIKNVSEQKNTQSSIPEEEKKKEVRIAIYNGTATAGLTKQAETLISEEYPDLNVTVRENAQQQNYVRTQVIDLSGEQTQVATDLAKLFSGQVVSSLPSSEEEPDSEILVIVGRDFDEDAQPTTIPTATSTPQTVQE